MQARRMQEGIRVLVVGSDSDHDLSIVTNDYVASGWMPQIVRMTNQEWLLEDVGEYVEHMNAALQCSTVSAAQRKLMESAYLPVAPGSNYFFQPHATHTELCSNTNTGNWTQIAARAIVDRYFSDRDNPLVAVVLSADAWAWPDVNRVWLDRFPTEVAIWMMCPDGTMEIMRCAGTAGVSV